MKKFGFRALIIVAFASTSNALCAAQQTLGEAARQARRNKPPEPTTKVITNDDFGRPWVSIQSDAGNTDAKSDGDKDKESAKQKQKPAAEQQAELDKQWRDRITAQNEKISFLQRELDVLQRENRQRATNYYGDAGNRLRNPGKYAEDDRKYRDDAAAKQKEIEDAKTELENLREQARKAGASGG